MSYKTSYPLVRTLRFKSVNSPGMLGRITTVIGNTGTKPLGCKAMEKIYDAKEAIGKGCIRL
jgi:hypothetical protein